jgi:hypothetical protein
MEFEYVIVTSRSIRLAQIRKKRQRIAIRSKCHGDLRCRILSVRHEGFGNGRPAQTDAPFISRDADYRCPVVFAEPDPMPERIGARPEQCRGSLVEDHHSRGSFHVRRIEMAPSPERHVEQPEVLRSDGSACHGYFLFAASPLNFQAGGGSPEQRHRRGRGRGPHVRRRRGSFDDGPHEPVTAGFPGVRRRLGQ